VEIPNWGGSTVSYEVYNQSKTLIWPLFLCFISLSEQRNEVHIMIDIRQSEAFADFMERLRWQIDTINGSKVYLRKFPLVGYFAKIPRPLPPIPPNLSVYKRSHGIFKLKIAPNIEVNNRCYSITKSSLIHQGFRTESSPFNPTTTIQIDLTKPEKELFQNFSEAKRRGCRRAIKNGIFVEESCDYPAFIEIRKHQYAPMGFLFSGEMKQLRDAFAPKKSSLLLARSNSGKALSGIYLLFHDRIAYYWYASALSEGKKLFAPTLLVWEAIKTAKKRGCTILDFEGVYDERFPEASKSWKGFTKFKEGFGGKTIILSENFSI
jgi:hypothetical protein